MSIVATLRSQNGLSYVRKTSPGSFSSRDPLTYLLTVRVLDKDDFTGRGTPSLYLYRCTYRMIPQFSMWRAVSKQTMVA